MVTARSTSSVVAIGARPTGRPSWGETTSKAGLPARETQCPPMYSASQSGAWLRRSPVEMAPVVTGRTVPAPG